MGVTAVSYGARAGNMNWAWIWHGLHVLGSKVTCLISLLYAIQVDVALFLLSIVPDFDIQFVGSLNNLVNLC